VQVGDADHRDGVAPDGGPEVLDNLLPIEVPVLGVDDDPVQPQRDRHLGHAGGFQRHPEPVHGPIGSELLAEFFDR